MGKFSIYKCVIAICGFIILFFCYSCNLYKNVFSYSLPEYDEENAWIDAYKYNFFLGCIDAGMKNDSLRLVLKSKDLFYPNADLTFYNVDEARDKGRKVIEKLPPPYIKIDIGDEQFYEGKNYISFTCLKYYASRELDKIVRKKYKEFVKQRKTDNKVLSD